jgi:hypothetical protein
MMEFISNNAEIGKKNYPLIVMMEFISNNATQYSCRLRLRLRVIKLRKLRLQRNEMCHFWSGGGGFLQDKGFVSLHFLYIYQHLLLNTRSRALN